LYTHVITHLGTDGLNNFIDTLGKKFPDKQLVLSGPASKCMKEIPANLQILHSLDEMIEFAKQTAIPTSALHNS
jgi:hypothetical protein